jgi:hypothetical protein
MKTLILSQKDVVTGSNNTVMEYNFPGGGIKVEEGSKVALASITMYSSTPNITTVYNNQSFSYIWVDGTTNTVTMPDGFYEISDVNNFLHQTMLNNGHYLIENTTGNFVWFLTMAVNTSTYKIDVVSYRMTALLFPIGVGAGNYTIGTGTAPAWTNPGLQAYPQLVVLSNSFTDIIGFVPGTYPALGLAGDNITVSSTFIPQVSPLSSYIVTCNLVNNSWSTPPNLLYNFPPASSFGRQFIVAPNEMAFIDTNPGYYSTFRVEFRDQENRNTVLLDPNITILIVYKPKEESK